MKDLNLLKKHTKYQETSYNFRLGFALSNRPHFNSTYLLRVPFSYGIAVCKFNVVLLSITHHLLLSIIKHCSSLLRFAFLFNFFSSELWLQLAMISVQSPILIEKCNLRSLWNWAACSVLLFFCLDVTWLIFFFTFSVVSNPVLSPGLSNAVWVYASHLQV